MAWAAANYICGNLLLPSLPELASVLEGHGHLVLKDDVRDQLPSLSPATADRLLRLFPIKDSRRGIGTTRSGPLLTHQIPAHLLGLDGE